MLMKVQRDQTVVRNLTVTKRKLVEKSSMTTGRDASSSIQGDEIHRGCALCKDGTFRTRDERHGCRGCISGRSKTWNMYVCLLATRRESPFTQALSIVIMEDRLTNIPLVVITEPSKGGLGAAIALALAEAKPACLILVGKFQGDSQPVVDEINRRLPTVKSLFISADFGNFESVRGAAKILKELDVPIDGIIASESITGLQYEKTDDGIESQFQVNYLSHFLLINILLDTMPKRKATRAVLVASSIRPDAAVPNFDNYNFSVSIPYQA